MDPAAILISSMLPSGHDGIILVRSQLTATRTRTSPSTTSPATACWAPAPSPAPRPPPRRRSPAHTHVPGGLTRSASPRPPCGRYSHPMSSADRPIHWPARCESPQVTGRQPCGDDTPPRPGRNNSWPLRRPVDHPDPRPAAPYGPPSDPRQATDPRPRSRHAARPRHRRHDAWLLKDGNSSVPARDRHSVAAHLSASSGHGCPDRSC